MKMLRNQKHGQETKKKSKISRNELLFKSISRLARFYGWGDGQILNLTPKKFWAYVKQAEILQAEEQLRFISSSSVPHLKDKAGKEKIVKGYLEIIDPRFKEKEEIENSFKIRKLMGKFGYKGKR